MGKIDLWLMGLGLACLVIAGVSMAYHNVNDKDSNSGIIEVGQENGGSYCNIEYFTFDELTTEAVEQNKKKCAEAVTKLFGSEKSENVLIRYQKHR